MRRRVAAVCLLPLASALSSAEPASVRLAVSKGEDIRFSHLTRKDGLSPGQVRDILQDKVGTLKMATFFAVAMSPWYFKPIAGLLSDAFPIFGTRRKSYMILGAIAAGFLWLLLGAVPHTYQAMLTVAVCMNVALVVISSSTAGLLVEDGQRLGATGRLTSARAMQTA